VLLPGFLRRQIIASLTAATTAAVRLADVDFNPFRGRLALQELTLTLKDVQQPVIAVHELVGNLRMLSLLRGRVSIEDVQLTGLRVTAIQQADGQLNLDRLFPPSPPSETPPPESDLPTLTVERFGVSAAQIDYQDHTRTPTAHFTLALKDLATGELGLQAKGLGAPVTVRWDGTLNDSLLHGEAQIFWQRTQTAVEATIATQRLALVAIEPYLRSSLALQRLSGHVGARLHYRYQNGSQQPPAHTLDGTLKLEQASFADPLSGQTALDLPSGQVTIEKIDLLGREIQLAAVEVSSPKLFFLQTAAGLNWTALVQTPDQAVQSKASQPAATPAWRFALQEARLRGGEVVYRDSAWTEGETLTLVPQEIQVQRIGGEEESPLRFQVRLGEGSLAGEGSLRFSPFGIRTQIQLAGVALTSLRPLLTRVLQVENVDGTLNGTVRTGLAARDDTQVVSLDGVLDATTLTIAGLPAPGNTLAWEGGHVELGEGSTLVPLNLGLNVQLSRVSLQNFTQGDISIEKASGNLRLAQAGGVVSEPSRETAVLEQTPLSIKAQGTLEVFSFLVTHGPEKQEVLGCYQARAKLNEGSWLLPLDLQLGDVALEYTYVQGFRTAAGQFQLFIPPSGESPSAPASSTGEPPPVVQPAQASSAPPSPALAVHIERVTLIGGQFYFEDHAITPSQTLYWQDIQVDLSDVGYPLARPAAFTLQAFNMDGAPIKAQGTTQRRGEQVLTRVQGKINRLSLPRFNAYLAPQLGYRVRNGAISLTWDLAIPGNRLRANAKVTLHDLGLSGKESSSILEEQVGLPLNLVVALLKDLNGNINLQVPVEGQLNEPGFRLGGTILRAIRDVLIGAVVSPLKLLGAVFSGGGKGKIEDFTLQPIRFVPGTNQPDSAGKEQLSRLSRFLAQRPELDVRLSGHTGPDDLQMLKDQLVLAQLQEGMPPPEAQKGIDAGQEGTAPQLTPQEEVRRFLSHRLDQSEGGEAPALSGEATALLADLREKTRVSPQALEQLTQERVQAVIAALTANSGVAASRLHLSQEKLRGREGAEVRYMIQAKEG
jgi:hypothetical protein